MTDGIHPVTSSEWELVQRRLDDLENLVTDMKLKLETLGECKCNRSTHLENQHSDGEETDTIIGLNTQSTSAASGIIDAAGQSTIQTEEILTSAGRCVVNTSDSTPVSMKSTSRLPNGIGIHELEKHRRAQVKLKRCDQVEVMGTSSSSKLKVENNKATLTLTSTNKGSHLSSKKCSVRQRKGNGGVQNALVSAPPLSHEKRFACHFCSKRFDGKSDLTRHIRVHSGDKPFQCNICSKTFTQESNLTRHSRVHTGDKPFECGFCSKKFSQKWNLVVHMRSHTKERPYTCQFCSREFAGRGNLAVHLRVHTREKPYSCPFCPKIYAHPHHLKRHLIGHPMEIPQHGQIHHQEVL